MNSFLLNLKFILKMSLSPKYLLSKIKENKKSRNMLIIAGAVILMCLPSYAIFMGLLRDVFVSIQKLSVQDPALNMEKLFIIMAIFLSAFIIVFFGVFQIMAFFYFSNDIKLLTPLPIKPSHYLLSKFFVIYIWELIISLFTVLPFFIIYGIYEGIGIVNWITMLINFIFIPVVPLVVVGIFTVILMKLSNLFRSKDAVRFFGYFLLIAGLVAFQFYFYSLMFQIPEGDEAAQIEFLHRLLENASYFLDKFALYYPITLFVNWGVMGNILEAIISVFALLLISILFIYLLSQVLQWLFLDTYLKEQNSIRKRRKLKITNRTFREGNVALGVAKIDFFTMLKVPVYFLNTISLVIIVPVILIVMSVLGRQGMKDNEFEQILSLYSSNSIIFWLIIALFLGVFAALNPIASTSFSREGKTNWIMRTLPISPKSHIIGRFLPGILVELVFGIFIVGALIFVVSTPDTLLQNLLYGIIALILGLISATFIIFMGLLIDLKRPMLKWENPQQPVKQNLNVLISLGIGMIYGTVMYLLYYLFSLFMPINLIVIVLFVINIFLVYIGYDILKRQFEQNLIAME